MEFNRGLLYHVESLEQDDTYGDYITGRIPEAVRRQLNPKAQSNMLFVSNSELRFVMEEDAVTIVLRRLPVSGQIKSRGILEVFSGDYQGSCEISPEVIDVNETEITIRRQDWSHICRFPRNPGGFAPQVMRVLLPYDWGCCIREIRGAIRPPKTEEMPEKRLLFYGSSITHGGNASVPSRTYAFQTAWELGYDFINLGSAGSAFMDCAMAEYIAGLTDWDAAVFELGVNVIEEWTDGQLYERAYQWIDTVKHAHPEKTVIVTDMYYNHYDFEGDERSDAFRKKIEECVSVLEKKYDRLYYKKGTEIMGTFRGLSSDGLHPSDAGHTMIAQNLTNFMRIHGL